MTDGSTGAGARALEDHDAFEPADDHTGTDESAYAVTTTPFEATVTAEPAEQDGRDAAFEVEVSMPTLDAAVAGEPVADVVEDGWFETLELRLADAFDVANADPSEDPEIERTDEQVVARFAFLAWDADAGVSDAKAIVDFIEGTYVQGVVPGYEYDDPVAGLLSRATESAGDDDGARRGGTPL